LKKYLTNLRKTNIRLIFDHELLMEINSNLIQLEDLAEFELVDCATDGDHEVQNGESTIGRISFVNIGQGKITIDTFDEEFIFYWLDGNSITLSKSLTHIVEGNSGFEIAETNIFYEKYRFFHPYATQIKDVFCSGFEVSLLIDLNNKNVCRNFHHSYIQKFNRCLTSISEYQKIIKKYLINEGSKFKNIIVFQSGMDSALVSAIASSISWVNDKKLYSVHLNLGNSHYLGVYQNKVVDQIHFSLPKVQVVSIDQHEYSEKSCRNCINDLALLVSDSVAKSWTTDLELWGFVDSFLDKKTDSALILQGDITSLYQHFNGTLEYLISPCSKFFGCFRRFLFGKWGLRIFALISIFSFNKKAIRFSCVSNAFLQPSLTGSYTGKLPNLVQIFNPPTTALFDLISELALNYLAIEPKGGIVGFHSFVRHQLLYTNVVRNINTGLPSNSRVSMLAPTEIIPFINHYSQPFLEILFPKWNIRKRLNSFGINIDQCVKNVRVSKDLKKAFWRDAFYENLGLISKIEPKFLKSWRKKVFGFRNKK